MRKPDLWRLVPGRASSTLRHVLAVGGACAFVVLMVAAGLPVLHWLYGTGWVEARHYHIAFALLCVLPAAAAHAGAAYSGFRGAAWWLAWLPGLAIYYAFPWPSGGTWQPIWIFGHAWDWGRTIFLHWETASPFAFNSFGAFVGVTTVTLVACLKLWFGAAKGVRRLGPGAVAANETDAALPSATWASRGEVVRRFSAKGGIVLGELTDPVKDSPRFSPGDRRSWGRQGHGQLITLSPEDGNGHVLVTSQASGYKSTGLVIPNILTYRQGPLVVFDPKCELYARTWKARKAMGFEPVVIDADNGFDPARLIAALAVEHPSAYQRMAKMVIPQGYSGIENAAYFKAAANNLFSALLAYYAETGSKSILQDVAKVLGRSADGVHSTVARKLEKITLPFVQNRLKGLKGMDPKFYASVTTEITNQLLFAEMPDVARYITMKEGSKVASQVIDPGCDIFLNIPQNVSEDFAAMLRVMLGSMLTAAQFVEVNEDPRARRLFLIDEAAKLGAMDILENIRDRGRSLGLHLMMFYQTPGEIEKLWGRAGMTSWKDGCSAVIMGPVSSQTSASEISAMIGTRTIRVPTKSTSSSNQVMSPMAGQVSMSEQEQLRDVPLMSPTALSQLPRHASIIRVPGEKPILASKAMWFARKGMQGRVRSTDEIRDELAVTGMRKALTKRLEGKAETTGNSGGREPDGAQPNGGKQPLSEQAKATRPRFASEPTDRPREVDPGEIRIEEDFVAPFVLDDEDGNGRAQPGSDAPAPATNSRDPEPLPKARCTETAGSRSQDGRRAASAENGAAEAADAAPDPAEARPEAREDEDAFEPALAVDGSLATEAPAPKPETEADMDKIGSTLPVSEGADGGPGDSDAERAARSASDAGQEVKEGGVAEQAEPCRSPEAGNPATGQGSASETELAPKGFGELKADVANSVGKPAREEEPDAANGHPKKADAAKNSRDGRADGVEAASAVGGSLATEAPAPDPEAKQVADRTGTKPPASEKADAETGDPEAEAEADADTDGPESARPEPVGGETGTDGSPSRESGAVSPDPDAEAAEVNTARETTLVASAGSGATGDTRTGDDAARPALQEDDRSVGVASESGAAEEAGPDGEGVDDWSAEESRRALLMLQDGVPPEEIARTLSRGLADTNAEITRMGRSAMVPGGRGATDGGEQENGT